MPELKLFKCVARMEDGKPKGNMIGGRPGKDHVWVHKSCVNAREKILMDALRKTQGWLTPEDRLDIGSLIEQFDAEENQ